MTTLHIIRRKRILRALNITFRVIGGAVALACLLLITACNASPTQACGHLSLFTFDNRTYYEIVGDRTNEVSRPGGGHGSNSRLYSDHLQGMVLYRSPSTAISNSTPITAELPFVK